MIFGAAIGSIIKSPILAIILAFLGHYFLDLIPHVEYQAKNLENKQWKKALPDIMKVFLDFFCGVILIFIFSKNYPLVYICGFFAILPDLLFVASEITKINLLKLHDYFHGDNVIHFLKNKKISNFWRILSQIFIVILSIYLLGL